MESMKTNFVPVGCVAMPQMFIPELAAILQGLQ
jgi:hypothetical protein